ncbi:hypothetical protein IWQ60_003427 [Tieghemiomyces parasiticus]|uniref:Choline/ethanolaminephosphotransferase n=1 Tax=Tieghemiomyces parasiticus TaxID=78921 RepID=A0A9W8AG73_9FUNG|nr:hypothetical protein IWQ60_003427 [Tieghemiomyces parasiticus]
MVLSRFTSGSSYVSKQGLENLKKYKYQAVDLSWTTHYILRHYWNWCVNLFPLWMAPNLITLTGLGFVVANLGFLLYYSPDLVGPAPAWVYYSSALGLWLYSTFDNVDGKQARRTGTSSPLGELFDHGCDALNCALAGLLQAASMGLGHSWHTVGIVFNTTLTFYLSTWEEYHTGVLFLGLINGPTEGMILACSLIVLSGWYGPQIYQANARTAFGNWAPSFLPADYKVADVATIMLLAGAVFTHAPYCLMAVYRVCKRKNQSYVVALLQLLPMTIFLGSAYLWLASPDSFIFSAQHLSLFILTAGIAFGRIATKIILAHVTQAPFPWFTVQIIPIILGAALTNVPRWLGQAPLLTAQTEHYFLWACFTFAAVAYTHWALLVIDEFCTFLNIKCLTIPYKAQDKAE